MTPSVAPSLHPSPSRPAGVSKQPLPDWVEWLPAEAPPAGDATPPIAVLLLDWQRFTPEATAFHRCVRQLNTDSALQENAQIEITFSPARQALEIHQIKVVRSGVEFDYTEPERFRLLQRETNLERHAYDDGVTAALHLEDLRPGDIIDLAYSLRDTAPGASDHVAVWQECEWEFPVSRFHYSVTFPATTELRYRTSQRQFAPVEAESDGFRRWTWERENIPGVADEEMAPSWYLRKGSIQLSSFPTWGQVSSFLAGQWGDGEAATGGLGEKVEEIKRTTASPENRVLLALRFVQNEVRTASVPFGCDGYSPVAPSEVFARRFGDSRDKASLLCTMLAACDVAAVPAAVSTRHRERLASLLPSPGLFDHVIVRVRTGGGFAWVDPTIPDQAGNLRFRALPEFRSALVIAPETMDLTTVDSSTQTRERLDIGERYVLGLRSFEPSVLVTTRATGAKADELRHQVRILGLEGAAARRAAHYANRYPGAEHSVESQLHEEQHGESAIVLNEQLILPEFGVLTDEGRAVDFTCTAHGIESHLARPTGRSRNTPLAIPYPARITHQIEVEAPGARDVTPGAHLVENAFFRFSSTTSTTLKGARLQFSYEALTDHVNPDGFRKYANAIEEVSNLLKFELTIPLLRGFPFRQKEASPLDDEGNATDATSPTKSHLANRKTGLVAPLRRKPHQDESYLRGIDELIDDDHGDDTSDAAAGTTAAPLERFPRSPGDPNDPNAAAASTRAPALREGKNPGMPDSDEDTMRRWNRSERNISLVNVLGVVGALVVTGVLVAAFTGAFSPDEVTVNTGSTNPLLMADERYGTAKAALEEANYPVALSILDELSVDFPEDSDITVARGIAHLELGEVEEALKCSGRVLERHPSHPEALTLHGRVSQALGKIEEARAILERSLSIDPEQVDALRTLGDLYFEFGDLTRAEETYSALLKRVPGDLGAITKLATLHDRVGNTFTAREVFINARNANPNNVDLALAHARFLSSHGDHHTAIHEAEAALALKPGRRATLAAIADLYRAAGDASNAKIFDDRATHATE